jgi:long-chain acyl-CoA synthetase
MDELTFSRLLAPAARHQGKHIAIIDGGYRATLEAHTERVYRLCRGLKSLGVGRSDRFAVMALNSHAYVELYHAAYLGAGVINPLNLRLFRSSSFAFRIVALRAGDRFLPARFS